MASSQASAAPIVLSQDDKDRLHTAITFRSLPAGDSSCWTWTGMFSKQGQPRIKVAGQAFNVRRILAVVYLGLALYGPHRLGTTCKNPACVNYDHVKIKTQSVGRLRRAAVRCHRLVA